MTLTATPLERTVMAALAAELRDDLPDLERQFAASAPRVRKNTGFGVFTEMEGSQSDRGRRAPGPTGDFGSVHAMVGSLPDPIAFTVRLINGLVVGLNGDSYGQDTRAIDFGSVHVSQVFTVDDAGRSIPFQSRLSPAPDPALSSQPHVRPRQSSVPATAAPPAARVARPEDLRRVLQAAGQSSTEIAGALRRAQDQFRADQDTARLPAAALAQRPSAPMVDAKPILQNRISLLISLYVVLAIAALIVILVFEWNPIFVLVAAFWIGHWVSNSKRLNALQKVLGQTQPAPEAAPRR